MMILDTMEFDVHPYNPRNVVEFVARTQANLQIETRSSIKLNRASPIHQGVGKDTRPKECAHCKATPTTNRLAIRIASVEGRWCWWYSASGDDPFGSYVCRLCYHYKLNKGEYPSPWVIDGWDTVDKVYLEAAPEGTDRSHCWQCKASSETRRNKWCGPLQKVLCDACMKENNTEIRTIVANERERRGLPPQDAVNCANCHKATKTGDRKTFLNVIYCAACGEYARNHGGDMRPLTKEQKAARAPRARRPPSKPKATKCDDCKHSRSSYSYVEETGKDLCKTCKGKYLAKQKEKAAGQG